jgi:hypothetical protein
MPAPPPSPSPSPSTLPAAPQRLVGRRAALAAIRKALTDPRPGGRTVVLSGMPGIGKTALAVAAARTLREEFPDGQLFLRAGHDPDSDIRERLAQTRTLVVLDDVRSAVQLRRLLPAEPRGAALITSQSLLSAWDASARIKLRPLTPADSAALLQHTAQRGQSRSRGLDPALVARLADHCGHLPLALRVVAARLALASDAQAGEVSARCLAEDLADRSARSALLDFDDLSVRRALLRPFRRLNRSGHRLDRAAATALRHLAEDGADSWEASSITSVLDAPGWEATEALGRLVEMSLLDAVGGRLCLHPLLRDFVRAPDDRSATRPTASAPPARRATGLWQACPARSNTARVARPRRAPREGGIMQVETCVELTETEELELTAEAAESADGPDWILFSW